ncbi:PREDICTED: farnesyl pyrophosphate synthase-like isoform X1 [Trachymyrmex septentrionalis]|uniref:farnesyl pyrophosphate synthase-like isoform X1 n=1 Tax=Trachymyrmex septentrionalis TaxID=34720 RepID=UPI00084EF562|nr:PREDICTED: farnesyl pyrophosphate synthase-like isoform X1 [Trachymyrmex septentrionalis]
MSSVARNRFLSALSVARRLVADVTVADYAHVTHISVRRGNTACWRTMDCNVRMVHSATQPTNTWVTSKDESREMMALWPDVVRDLTDSTKNFIISDVTKWMAKILQYNVPGGKKIRALTLVYAYKVLAPSDQLTKENIRLARILAWCLELCQAFGLVADDIVDRSLLRRGKPCWYRYNGIGLAAINDSLLLECSIFYLIKKYFKEKDCYVILLEMFYDSILKTVMGQSLDLLSTNFGKKPNLDLFTMNRYNSICHYKASHFSFILPITVAMQLAGIKDPEMFRQAKTILLEMGHLFQVQDDYLGCYSDVHGKDCTDIQEGKCTWLIVVALQRATPEQRKILEECYGSPDPERVRRVKQLFTDLGLPNTYSIYEEETYNLLNVHIQQISCGLPHSLFLNLLRKIYHRVS